MLTHKLPLLCLGVLLVISASCRQGNDSVPDHLIGTWQTSTATHAGSTIEITKHLLVFSSVRGGDVRARIIAFKSVLDRSQTVYQLSYQDQYKNEYQLHLLYDPVDGGTVRLKNQPQIIWKHMGAQS
jgi:hypothetical protein